MNAIKNLTSKLTRNKKDDPTKIPITNPLDFDILLGRGKTSFNHVGNRRFRVFIGLHLRRYMDASSRMEKTLVVNGVVEAIEEAGGRFLKYESKTGKWFQVTPKTAREKVGHALRDAVGMRLKMAAGGDISASGAAVGSLMVMLDERRGSGAVRRCSASAIAKQQHRRASHHDAMAAAAAAAQDAACTRFSRSCNDLSATMAQDAKQALIELAGLDDDDDDDGLPLAGGSSELNFPQASRRPSPPRATDETPRIGSSKKIVLKKAASAPLVKTTVPNQSPGNDRRLWEGGSAEFSVMSEATVKNWGCDPGSGDFSITTVDSKVFDDNEADDPDLPKHLMAKVNKALTDMESSGELAVSSKAKKGGQASGLFRRKQNISKKLGKYKSTASISTDDNLSEEFSVMSIDPRGKFDMGEFDFGTKSEEFGLRSEEFMKERFQETTVEFADPASRNNSLVSALRNSTATLEIDVNELTASRSNSLVSAMRESSTEFSFKAADFDKLRASTASDLDKLRNSPYSLNISERRLSSTEFTLAIIDEQAASDSMMRTSKITWSDGVHPKTAPLMDTVDEGSDDNDFILPNHCDEKSSKGDEIASDRSKQQGDWSGVDLDPLFAA